MRSLLPSLKSDRDPFRNLFDSLFADRLPELFANDLQPRTNIAETDTSYVLSFELPGIDEKDIQVQVHDRQLTVTAERREDGKTDSKTWHRVEQHYGTLTRSVLLPEPTRPEAVEATYRQGILTVTLPKRPESVPTKVQIKKA